jgi:hypothetical protein
MMVILVVVSCTVSWYQNPLINITTVPGTTRDNRTVSQQPHNTMMLPSTILSNPLDTLTRRVDTPKRSTQTLGSREVWEEAHATFKLLLNGVQTEEDLLELKAQLLAIQ